MKISVNASKKAIKAESSDVRTFRNKRNENKYLETKKYDDGHTVSRGYMKWDTPRGEVKNYMGSKSNRGRWHRMNKGTLDEVVVDDYEEIESSENIEASNEPLLRSSDGMFELIERQGVGMNRTPWRGLEVRSLGPAEEHVVEIRLEQNNVDMDGEPIDLSYHGLYIAHGMRGRVDTLADTAEYIEVLQNALDFAPQIEEYMIANGWME